MNDELRRKYARMIEDGEVDALAPAEIFAAAEHYVNSGQAAPQTLLAALSAVTQRNTAPGWISQAVQYGRYIRIVKYRAKYAAEAAPILLQTPRK